MVEKHLVSNFDNMFRAKLYFFSKKSVWIYLLCSLIYAFINPFFSFNWLTSFLLYFLVVVVIALVLIYISAKIMGKKVDFDADVKFTDDIIEIRHRNKELIETKDWGWIKNIENKKDRLWLVVNANTPFGISFPKDKLTEEELNFFLEKVKGKNGH